MTDVADRLGLDGQFDAADLIAYIRDQRWFGARSKDITGIALVDAVPLPGDERAWLVLLESRFETGTHETYQLVLGTGEKGEARDEIATLDDGVLYEASRTPDRSSDRQRPTHRNDIRRPRRKCRVARHRAEPAADENAEVRPLGADQSNTSLVVGIDPREDVPAARSGAQPRARDAALPHRARLRARTARPRAGTATRGRTCVRRSASASRSFPTRVTAGRSRLEEVPAFGDGFLDRLSRLGTIVGEMHCVLAADSEDPAFAPEEPTPETAGPAHRDDRESRSTRPTRCSPRTTR